MSLVSLFQNERKKKKLSFRMMARCEGVLSGDEESGIIEKNSLNQKASPLPPPHKTERTWFVKSF